MGDSWAPTISIPDLRLETITVRAHSRRLGRRVTHRWRGKKFSYFVPTVWTCEAPTINGRLPR